MKKNTRDDIKAKSVAELAKKAAELNKQIAAERLKTQTSSVKNVHAVRLIKRELAVVLTVQKAKELSEVKE